MKLKLPLFLVIKLKSIKDKICLLLTRYSSPDNSISVALVSTRLCRGFSSSVTRSAADLEADDDQDENREDKDEEADEEDEEEDAWMAATATAAAAAAEARSVSGTTLTLTMRWGGTTSTRLILTSSYSNDILAARFSFRYLAKSVRRICATVELPDNSNMNHWLVAF